MARVERPRVSIYDDPAKREALARFLDEVCPECETPGPWRHLSAVGGCKTCVGSDPRPVLVFPLRERGKCGSKCYRMPGGSMVHVKPECKR